MKILLTTLFCLLLSSVTWVVIKSVQLFYDLTYLPARRYIIDVIIDDTSRFKRRFNKE